MSSPLALATALAAGALLTLAVRPGPRSQEDGTEPPERFTLEVGSQRVEVRLDEPFELALDGGRVPARLGVRPTREFRLDALAFEYPRGMNFSADLDGGFSQWTLDGDDAVLLLDRTRMEPDALEDYLAARVEGLRASLVTRDLGAVELALDGREVPGRCLRLAVGNDVEIEQRLYAFHAAGAVWVLTLQDSLTDDDERTDEMAELEELVLDTFRFTPE